MNPNKPKDWKFGGRYTSVEMRITIDNKLLSEHAKAVLPSAIIECVGGLRAQLAFLADPDVVAVEASVTALDQFTTLPIDLALGVIEEDDIVTSGSNP